MICSGTLPNNITITGTLHDIADRVERLKNLIHSPALIVVGKVVKLRKKIFPCGLEFDLIPIGQMKPHEGFFVDRVKKIKNEIVKSKMLNSPLWISKNDLVILNGHHRLQSLKELGCKSAPCYLLDYSSPYIQVNICPGAKTQSISKKSILHAARSGKIYPPRSSLHQPLFEIPDIPVPLNLLK